MQPLTRLDTAERHHPASRELTKECFVRLAYATHGSDLAESVSEVLNRCRSDPTDGGFSACALAFSTLLSSQGADAHHRRPCNLLRGNPMNLPEQPEVVNQVRKTRLTSLLVVHPAYPHCAAPFSGANNLGGCPAGPLQRSARWRSARSRGQDETLGSKGDQVKSAISTPPTVRFPRRSTRKRPCSRSLSSGAASTSGTFTLFR